MRQLIAGNWKMNGLLEGASALCRAVMAGSGTTACDLLICPPATLLAPLSTVLRGSAVALGGQDCHGRAGGAHTGDISAAMLRDAGATWVILGHSERRADHFETDADVLAKVLAAVKAGITPIVCVGETESQRVAGQEMDVVAAQLVGSLPSDFQGVIAYEPIWAIGTGRTPTIADVAAMHTHIRATLVSHLNAAGHMAGRHTRILYGGSVKPSNAAEILAVPDVGGALVGGASLNAMDFLAVAHASHMVAAAALAR